ncbi:hypothetical protein E0504_14095 [Parafrankia sp. BMG5.11]|nr:hypothetical protein E0504_14095 [Parafrankia sp. BMG5.11]
MPVGAACLTTCSASIAPTRGFARAFPFGTICGLVQGAGYQLGIDLGVSETTVAAIEAGWPAVVPIGGSASVPTIPHIGVRPGLGLVRDRRPHGDAVRVRRRGRRGTRPDIAAPSARAGGMCRVRKADAAHRR